ncbi:polysaccharide lyase family 14 protein [Athelia psychrophila]|uniref:Polysaccharide lyase family 14 protein n=1 Tax=Athelia psychrophila TaxID=1759441 RepID=A0A166XDV3_9AGAM|nr:polysaccharide lyase family 14 protein [Fibularhizoctonia sp. CBS 109695]
MLLSFLCITTATAGLARAGALTAASSVATQFSLTTSTSLPFPTATLASSDAVNFIQDISNGWSLSKGTIQNNPNNTAFVNDPFPDSPTPGLNPSNTTGPVLQVTYPAGSLHDYGGTQLYSMWNTSDGSSFNSVLLSYEVAFDSDFDWVKGGKLPGLRGGPEVNGCAGGVEPNGTDCFSSRVMWRTSAAGEVYAYIPTPDNLCGEAASEIICNSDYGVSVERGSYSFVAGQWNRITMLVQMNSPANIANGNLLLYYNDVPAISQSNLVFRSGDDVNIGGLYLSTFFGGSDSTWAPRSNVNSYFRNFEMWGSSSPSNLSGSTVSTSGASYTVELPRLRWVMGGACLLFSWGLVGL